MKALRPLLPALLFLVQMQAGAQLQWYQDQDGPNQYPSGTMPTCILPFNANSFLSLYLWSTDADNNFVWKISRSSLSGTEEKTFYISGRFSQVQMKIASNGFIYAMESSYPAGAGPVYTLFKLDGNLSMKAQRTISLPGTFTIYNINAFATDDDANIYVAGDGATQDQSPASFVIKSSSNFLTRWNHIDTIPTSFTQMQVDHHGTVWLMEDYYSFYPDVHIRSISQSGAMERVNTLTTSPGRQGISMQLDAADNLLLYGNEMDSNYMVDVFLYKFNSSSRQIVYRKSFFTSQYIYINDLKQDGTGNIFALTTWFNSSWEQTSRVCSIYPNNGSVIWSQDFSYVQDSITLNRLAIGRGNLLYAVGQQSQDLNWSRGYAVRLQKWGGSLSNLQGPDSVSFYKMHYLMDGIADRNDQLIAVGATNDLDPITFTSTYSRAFASRYNNVAPLVRSSGTQTTDQPQTNTNAATNEPAAGKAILAYPNPAKDHITVTGSDLGGYSKLSLMDEKGKAVWQQMLNGSAVTINVGSLPNGNYTIWLSAGRDGLQKAVRFIVSR